jgi:hypothetical protein
VNWALLMWSKTLKNRWYKFLYMLYYLSFSYRHNMQLC